MTTLLPNGKVLVAGVRNISDGYLITSELHDPGTNTWGTVKNMNNWRELHTATLLPSGKVLVAGGRNQGNENPNLTLSSAVLYDPTTDSWSTVGAGSLSTGRCYHTATLLPNGKVLVAGGAASGILASAEIYNPATGTWGSGGSMSNARYLHRATLLPNGKALLAGGADFLSGQALNSTELYDTAAATWGKSWNLFTARYEHTAALLGNGKVLVAGGRGSGSVPLNSAQVFPSQTVAPFSFQLLLQD